MIQNARRHNRVKMRCPATVTLLDGTALSAHTLDLSAGGVCLHLDSQIRLAQLCAVRFVAQIDGSARKVLAMGQVVYSDPFSDGTAGFKAGVQFIQIDPGSVAAVAELVAVTEAADAPG